MTDLFERRNGHESRIVAEYDYRDENGALQAQVVRYAPKDFRQRRPDGRGGWTWRTAGLKPLPYRLNEFQGQHTVFICEGEKDCDRLWALGLPATCNAGGALKWRHGHTERIQAAGVQAVGVIPDNDAAGRKHADAVARSCHAAGLRVRVIELPGLPPKGDVSDWLATHTKEDFVALAQTMPVFDPTAAPVEEEPPTPTEEVHSESSDRTSPRNLEAERAVLGTLLVANEMWPRIASVLVADDFAHNPHRLIFRAMVRLMETRQPIDLVCLVNDLTVAGELEAVGGRAWLEGLTQGEAVIANIEAHAQIVKEKRRLRDIIATATQAITAAFEADKSSDIIEQGVRALLTLGSPESSGVHSIGQAVNEYVRLFDETSTNAGVLKVGYSDVDQFFAGGISLQQLMIVAARPSMGKTTLALNMAENMAASGIPVAFFSLEMSRLVLAEQALARHARMDSQRLKSRMISQSDWGRIHTAMETLQPLPVLLVEEAHKLTQIDAWCRRLKDEYKIGVAIVDYIQLMGGDGGNLREQVTYISKGLKRTAKDLNLLVIGLSQLSRAPEGRKDKRPMLSDLRESGSLEQDADIVLMIYRDEAYNSDSAARGVAEVIVAKNRTGPLGVVKLAFLKEQLRFAPLADDPS